VIAAVPVALGVPLFLLGTLVAGLTFLSAISTVVVPRGVPVRLSRAVFLWVRRLFELRARFADSYEQRDRAMARYAPVTLVLLPVVWLTFALAAYTAMFLALGVWPLREAFLTSGSSLLTLGFATVHDVPTTVLAVTEAVVGLLLLALLITYLPSMYAAFARREALVTMNAIQAGNPPSAVELLQRFHELRDLDELEAEVWRPWSGWFIDIEESHTSLGALALFRSPQPERSWVTAAGSVLDAASLLSSTLDVERQPAAELCIRAGYLSLRSIADFYGIGYDPDPDPGDPISVDRGEFDGVVARLASAGVPLREDLDQAWRDFRGWRVNYDTVLVTLAGFTAAPYAPWSSDRSPTRAHRPPVRRRRR
jgi:hypothetical protein